MPFSNPLKTIAIKHTHYFMCSHPTHAHTFSVKYFVIAQIVRYLNLIIIFPHCCILFYCITKNIHSKRLVSHNQCIHWNTVKINQVLHTFYIRWNVATRFPAYVLVPFKICYAMRCIGRIFVVKPTGKTYKAMFFISFLWNSKEPFFICKFCRNVSSIFNGKLFE